MKCLSNNDYTGHNTINYIYDISEKKPVNIKCKK